MAEESLVVVKNDVKNKLEIQISETIDKIKNNLASPKESGIAKMFKELQDQPEFDFRNPPSTYIELMKDYKSIVNVNFIYNMKEVEAPEGVKVFKSEEHYNNGVPTKKKKSSDLRADDLMIGLEVDLDEDPEKAAKRLFSKRGPISKPLGKIDKSRVSKVKLIKPKRDPNAPVIRDRTSYIYMGETYGKGPLVRAVIAHEIVKTPTLTYEQLKRIYPDDLLRGYGIFKKYPEALSMSKTRKRYFLKDDQIIKLACGTKIAVTNQFTGDNIKPFLEITTKRGHKIAMAA